MLFHLAWDEGFKCSCFDVFMKSCSRFSARCASLVPAHQFLSLLESCGERLVVGIDLEPRFVAEVLCALLHSDNTPQRAHFLNALRPDGVAQEQCRSFHFLSTPEVQHERVRSSPERPGLVLHLPGQTVYQPLRS